MNSHYDKKNLKDIIEKFLTIPSTRNARHILEKHPELLNVEADSMLNTILSEKNAGLIQNRRELLTLCREIGIDQAFEESSNYSNGISNDLDMMLKKLDHLSRPDDMPIRIVILQNALSLIQSQSDSELWATLQEDLGVSLYQNHQGDSDDNIERAIEHLTQATEVFTYTDFPMQWATLQNNLGLAYCTRNLEDKAKNIETAIEYYNQTLKVYTYHDFPDDWAMTQNNLANAYYSRILGDKAENLKKAIEYYNQALKVYTYHDFPEDWATIQNNLGLAYSDRILGDRAENIEKAIEYYNQTLKVYTYHDFPDDWAMTQNNFANAYYNRILGDKAENLEKAIEYYNQALKVYTYHDFPEDWATIQNNLGLAYSDRILGDRAENIEKAIKYYKRALKVRSYQYSPVKWAMTQNSLANAYSDRIQGDKAGNIEQAIKCYNQVVEVYTYKDSPVKWAMTQNNLGLAYSDRILGDRTGNIEKAIEYYKQALKVRTYHDFPEDWAMTLNNLAVAYNNRIEGDKAENIEKALKRYNQALKVYTRDDFPVKWAMTQNNLGSAYYIRILGNMAENIEKAIKYYKRALEVRTQKDLPLDWAMTQNNLANAYYNRILEDKAENLDQAISHCHKALQIYNIGSMPNDFRIACRLLGDLYLDKGQWENAMKCYEQAIKAGDILYRSGLSAESKTVEIGENVHIYRNAALVACRLGLVDEGLMILEKGKTRLLVESLRLKIKPPEGIPNEVWMKYKNAAEKYRTVTRITDIMGDYAQREKKIQKSLEELDTALKIVQEYNPEFWKELEIPDIISTEDKETAILTFCITNKGSIGFLVGELTGIILVDIPDFNIEDLNNLLFKLDEQRHLTGGLIGNYLKYTDALGTENHVDAFKAWQNTLNVGLFEIGTKLLHPIIEKLPSQIKKLILLPSGGLSPLPLHATPLSDGQLLCQRYCISYAPSIQLLKEMRSKAKTVEGKGLYAIINPQEDPALVFSSFEGQAISKFFQSPLINVGEIGTKPTILQNVLGKAYLHFSCHGSYNWSDPSQSGLYLVGGRTLSLTDLQNDIMDISSARLVTLSACETGITDILKGSADEFVGLPVGFMLAGVPCVISSLWSVPEISTAILMERFYSNHIAGGMDIPLALQEAQLWVRELTSIQVKDYVEKCYRLGKWEGESKEKIEHYREHYLELSEKYPYEKPFKHPYYWAAFTVNGA